MIPNNVQQFLNISISDTFTKPNTQPTLAHPLMLTNISQYDIIFRLRSNYAKFLTSNYSTGRIGPFQSHKYPLTLKGQMPKDIVIKLEIMWCKIVTNNTEIGHDINTLFGKVDNQNVGKKIITIKRNNDPLFLQQKQPLSQQKTQINENSPTKNIRSSNNNIEKQQKTFKKLQKQEHSTSLSSQKQKDKTNQQNLQQINNILTKQNNYLKQRIIQLQKIISQNQSINLSLKQMNSQIKKFPQQMFHFFTSGYIQQQLDNRPNVEMEKRIIAITQMIYGLMKPTGLKQLLVKIENLSIQKKLLTQKKENNQVPNNQKHGLVECIEIKVPEYVSKLEQAFYQFALELLKKIKQKQKILNCKMPDVNNMI